MSTKPSNITKLRMQWAATHAWFRLSIVLRGTVYVHYRVVVSDAGAPLGMRCFDRFDELQEWAAGQN